MHNLPLDIYDEMPTDMKRYITHFGWHFNKKAYDYAVSLMVKRDDNGNEISIKPYTKEEVDELIRKYGVKIQNKILHDYVFVASMCKADYYGSSIINEQQLVLYVKDTVDDVDASDSTTFRRWVATMIGNGTAIEWSDLC